jgi:small subunit ribosomal protein S6
VREYETTIIVQPEISDDGIVALQERIDGTLDTSGSIRLIYDDLGKRRLAYEIQDFQKGRYLMLRFLDNGSAISGIERAFRLEDSIMRYLTVQVDDAVDNVAERKAAAVEEERIRVEKAAERAAREAEEAKRQEVEAAEAAKLAEEARVAKEAEAAAAAEAAAEAGEGDEAGEEDSSGADSESSEAAEAKTEAEPAAEAPSGDEAAAGKEEVSS